MKTTKSKKKAKIKISFGFIFLICYSSIDVFKNNLRMCSHIKVLPIKD